MSAHSFTWSHGSADVLTTAGMISRCMFTVNGREFSPFVQPSWESDEFPDLPAHLRVLGAEFVCVPFGEAGPVTRSTEGWGSAETVPANVPGHGYSASAEWAIVDERPGGVTLRVEYPESHDIASLERRIDGIPGVPGLALSLTIIARRPTRTSIGLHPILRLPTRPHSLAIDASYRFGLTFPADLTGGKRRSARGAHFSSLVSVPLEAASSHGTPESVSDFSLLPLNEPTEEVLQLCEVYDPIVVHYLDEDASVTVEWDRTILPSALIWIEDLALTGPPWNGTYRGLGLEPIVSAFDFANDISVCDNPISAQGIATSIEIVPASPLSIDYRIVASGLRSNAHTTLMRGDDRENGERKGTS